MSWNYRVVKKICNGEDTYHIHEAYYDENGKVKWITKGSISPFGETPPELKETLLLMLKAMEEPILNYNDF